MEMTHGNANTRISQERPSRQRIVAQPKRLWLWRDEFYQLRLGRLGFSLNIKLSTREDIKQLHTNKC